MYTNQQHPLWYTRELVRQLHYLGNTGAPAHVLPAVLARVGLGDAYAELETPIGPFYVAYSKLGISAVMRSASADDFEQAFRTRFGRSVQRVAAPPASLMRMVHRHLSGRGRSPLRFDLRQLSIFERQVLLKVRDIPRGEVRPYAWVAREIGHPAAVRAVGSVLGRNPIPLLIPCHRVVRSDGSLGDYAFGRDTKRAVLVTEGIDVAILDDLVRAGTRYYGSRTTHIYCFPTCRHARRVTDRHRVVFRSETDAAAAGYRPCRVCRPALAS